MGFKGKANQGLGLKSGNSGNIWNQGFQGNTGLSGAIKSKVAEAQKNKKTKK